jgi:hypothetical protein
MNDSGRYSAESEHDRCGVGFVGNINGKLPGTAGRHYATSADLNVDFKKAVGEVAQNQAQSTPVMGRIQPSPYLDNQVFPLETIPDVPVQTPSGPEWSRTIDLVVISDAL